MPASRRYAQPVSFVIPEGAFPDGPFREGAPTYALVTAGLVANVLAAMRSVSPPASIRSVAALGGINPGTLSRLLRGEAVPDLGTIAALEEALDVELWPGRVAGL